MLFLLLYLKHADLVWMILIWVFVKENLVL